MDADSADEFDAAPDAVRRVTVVDDDTAGVTVSETTLTAPEGGSATYTVRLDAQPTSDVVISVTESGSSDVTVSPATLTFTTANWGTAQTVTVSAAQDADAVNDAASITHAVAASSSANEYDAATIAGVTVAVDDDDTAGVTVSASSVTVAEGGSATYTVVLDAQPTSDVVINVTKSGSSDVTGVSGHSDLHDGQLGHGADGDGVRRPGRRRGERRGLHRPRGGGRQQRQRVRRRDHRRGGGDRHRRRRRRGDRVRHFSDGAGGRQRNLHGGPGRSAHSNVVINVTKSGSSDVTVSPARLTFTTANWGTAQTVTVSAAQDADAVNDAASIAHAVVDASSADEFDAVTIAGVAVTVTDDDAAGATVSETTVTVSEGGSATYTVWSWTLSPPPTW